MAAVQLFMFIHTAGDKLSYTYVLNTLTQRLYHVVVHSEKMASKTKRSRPNRIRHRIETECETEAEKEALARRLDRVRQLLTPPGSRGIDNGANDVECHVRHRGERSRRRCPCLPPAHGL